MILDHQYCLFLKARFSKLETDVSFFSNTLKNSPIFARYSNEFNDVIQGIVGSVHPGLATQGTRAQGRGTLPAVHVATSALGHGGRHVAATSGTREQVKHVLVTDFTTWSLANSSWMRNYIVIAVISLDDVHHLHF